MRHGIITTEEAISILVRDGSIYWTDEGYLNDKVDWLMVSLFFNTQEIHTYCNGMVTRIL